MATETLLTDLVTVGITTFGRPEALERLQRSIQRWCPGLRAVVIDTGSNLSWGRNQLTRAVETPLLLLCEEDFELTADSQIGALHEVLDHDQEIMGVGGSLLEPRGRVCWAHDFTRQGDAIVARPSRVPRRTTPRGLVYQPCHLIYNFGLFRRTLFERILWDENLPLQEHLDYYWRVSEAGAGKMAVAQGVLVLHHKDRPSEEYRQYRSRRFDHLANAKHQARLLAEEQYRWDEEVS